MSRQAAKAGSAGSTASAEGRQAGMQEGSWATLKDMSGRFLNSYESPLQFEPCAATVTTHAVVNLCTPMSVPIGNSSADKRAAR
jgi:hypothetical protein